MAAALTRSSTGPFHPPVSNPQTSRWLAYERKVGRVLEQEARALGFTFRDHEWLRIDGAPDKTEGFGQAPIAGYATEGTTLSLSCPIYHQPDFILESESGLLLFECKLTFREDAFSQLGRYKKVLTQYGNETRPITPVVVCRNLVPEAPEPVACFSDLTPWCVWHLYL